MSNQGNNSGWGGARSGAGRKKNSEKPPPTGEARLPGARTPKKKKPALSLEASRQQEQQQQQNAEQRARIEQRKKEKDEQLRAEKLAAQKKKEEEAMEALQRLADEVMPDETAAGALGAGGGDDDGEDPDDESDDEDYDDDEESMSGSEDNNDDADFADDTFRPNRKSSRYKPPPGSVLAKHLKNLKDKILAPENRQALRNGKCWYPPESDPLSTSSDDPDEWYCSQIWAYVFDPRYQHEKLMGNGEHIKQKCKCLHCGRTGMLRSNEFEWRPMHWFEKLVWVLHNRLQCHHADCMRTMATIDPRFLNQLPTLIVERFPFLTTVNGPGMHQMMMYQFMNLATKGVLFGSYAKSINELKRVSHDGTHISYLDLLHLQRSELLEGPEHFTPRPFAPFWSPGQYNGLLVRASLVRHLFFRVMESMESYNQKTFQVTSDIGVSADHTFKYSNSIMVGIHAGKHFHASYGCVSLGGLINFNRPTYTKSNSEIEPLVEQYRQARLNNGVPKLLRYESDGGGDRSVWEAKFPELKEGVKEYRPQKIDGLPAASIIENDYQVFTTNREANDWADVIISKVHASKLTTIYIGLDTEWNQDETHDLTRTLQLAFPSEITDAVAVLHLSQMDAMESESFPTRVRALLELPRIVPCGVHVHLDTKRLLELGVKVETSRDVSTFAKQVHPNDPGGYGMKAMCARYLQVAVDKHGQNADYRPPLSNRLAEYAALDARLSLRLFEAVLAESKFVIRDSQIDATQMSGAKVGETVHYFKRNRLVAIGELVFIGGTEGGQRRWGKLLIGRGKSLVRLKEVKVAGELLSFSFVPTTDEKNAGALSFDKKKTTLRDMLQQENEEYHVVALNTAHLRKPIQNMTIDAFVESSQQTSASQQTAHSTSEAMPAADSIMVDRDDDSVDCLDDDVDYNDDTPRNRMKSDVFHVMQDLPLRRTCPVRTLVSRLLVQATYEFDAEDFNDVSAYLSTKNVVTLEELLDHYFYNEDWWREHVKMYTPPAALHAERIRWVHDFIKTEETTAEYYNEDYKQSFFQLPEDGGEIRMSL